MVKKKDIISEVIGSITSYLVEEVKENGIFFFKSLIKKTIKKKILMMTFFISGIILIGMGFSELLATYFDKSYSYLIIGTILIIIGFIQSY